MAEEHAPETVLGVMRAERDRAVRPRASSPPEQGLDAMSTDDY